MALKCPKCGKEYSPRSKHPYEKHIATCKGKQPKSVKKAKKTANAQLKDDILGIKNVIIDLEKRILRIESKLQLDKANLALSGSNRECSVDRFKDDEEFESEIIKIVNHISEFNHVKSNFPLKDVKEILLRNYGISEREFENRILKLYRRQVVDLQPGGDPAEYHLLSPTGKKFYYLVIKS